MKQFVADETAAGRRIDHFLTTVYPDYSRSTIGKLFDAGSVQVNGKTAKSSHKLRPGESVSVDDHFLTDKPAPVDLPITYEDEDVVVIDKPAGVLTHSKGTFNPEGTVASWLLEHLHKSHQQLAFKDTTSNRLGIVHRLDRATSGIMICAKNSDAQAWLQKQFSTRRVKKTYLALVAGVPQPAEALIDAPIGRNPKKPQTFRTDPNGKPAQTYYKVIAAGTFKNSPAALVALQPTTGRTHQLRVHLHYLNHPIIGDVLYGGPPADRLYLHAEKLEITLPNRQREVFTSPLPAGFRGRLSNAA
jgi:23S rRNA pseudouridine1911/1915/1917 synthase